jgi:allantoicase
MKITRLKQGYVIRCSDSDFGMLRNMVIDGFAYQEGDEQWCDGWEPAEKAAFSRRCREEMSGREMMRVDKDRRGGQ